MSEAWLWHLDPKNPKLLLHDIVKKVLIVEDDPKIAKALALRVGNAGYETLLAYDALAGVSMAVKLRPDLVLLDISLPAGNGFSVAERIQKMIPKATPIIFLTASKEASFIEKAITLGAAGYFEKPYNSEALLDTIRQRLSDQPERQSDGPKFAL